MATTAAPYGARPVGTLSSSGSFTSKTRNLPIITTYGTQISNGDFVKVASNGTIEKDTGTTALTAVGIFLGCSYTDPTTSQKTFSNLWPASNAATDAMAYVLDDPFVLFQMQADEALNTTDRGLNASVVVTSVSPRARLMAAPQQQRTRCLFALLISLMARKACRRRALRQVMHIQM